MIKISPKKIYVLRGSPSEALRAMLIYVVTVHKLSCLLGFNWGTPKPQFFSCELDLVKFQSYIKMKSLFLFLVYVFGVISN